MYGCAYLSRFVQLRRWDLLSIQNPIHYKAWWWWFPVDLYAKVTRLVSALINPGGKCHQFNPVTVSQFL